MSAPSRRNLYLFSDKTWPLEATYVTHGGNIDNGRITVLFAAITICGVLVADHCWAEWPYAPLTCPPGSRVRLRATVKECFKARRSDPDRRMFDYEFVDLRDVEPIWTPDR